jgi:hypothetical protein
LRGRRTAHERADLFVRGLTEVLVPHADGLERLRRAGAHDRVGLVLEFRTGLGRRDRDGDDDLGGVAFSESPHGGAHR